MTAPHLARIDTTPFIGVLLPLIAVLMVAVPSGTANVPLDDWHGDPSPTAPTHYMAVVSIMSRNIIYVDQNRASLAHLPRELDTAFGDASRHRVVMVRADKDASYDDFVRVADTLQRSGYRVRLINEDIE